MNLTSTAVYSDMETMRIYPALFKPAGLRNGWSGNNQPSSDYMYASLLLSGIEANMELSESADEIADCFSGMFPDVAVSEDGEGIFSFMSDKGGIVRIMENSAGEISLNLGKSHEEGEPSLDITELGPEVASEYIMSVLCHRDHEQC